MLRASVRSHVLLHGGASAAAAAGAVAGSAAIAAMPAYHAAQSIRRISTAAHGAAAASAWGVGGAAVPAAHAHFRGIRSLHSSAAALSRGPRGLPTRGARHDREWDKVRRHRDPRITTVDPATKAPVLPANELEIDQLSFRYGLPPLPTLTERLNKYHIEQSYYQRRDARIKDHLGRLLRMKSLSKAEMLILIAQVEEAHWNLDTAQRAYVPELYHAFRDEADDHRKTLQLGTGGMKVKADYRAKKDAKREAKKSGAEIKPPGGDGEPKYGYRRDLANIGPETWDYLSPYVILEPEARHSSYLDGAFKDEDRYIQWDVEARNLAVAAKLQRMKQLGIPLSMASSMVTPDRVPQDHVYPTSGIRRALKKLHARGGRPTDAWWRQFQGRSGNRAANERLLRRKEAKTLTEARRNIPAYIERFEREQNAVEINAGATTVLAQNLFLQQRIAEEAKKPSLLTPLQQQSARNLLGVFAQRNRLAMKKMFLSTKTMWERLMIERAIERKYLEQYLTVGSDDINSKYLLKLEAEMMAMVEEVNERFKENDWAMMALELRDVRHAQMFESSDYTDRYIEKMEELMDKNQELPLQENAGQSNWTKDIVNWEIDPSTNLENAEQDAVDLAQEEEIDRELDTWNDWFDVQVAQELGSMIDCGEVAGEKDVQEGAIRLAEKRVAQRLHATRTEWKEWKYRPQYTNIEDMNAIPDVTRADEESLHSSHLGAAEKSPGAQIIAQILAKDPMIAKSKRWKERMAPRYAEVDRYENEAQAGAFVRSVDPLTGKFLPGAAQALNGEAALTTGAGSALVDSVHGEGSVLNNFAEGLSTAGHAMMDPTNAAQRRAMYDHSITVPDQVDEYVRHEAMDPMLELLRDHVANQRGGLVKKKSSSGDDATDANSFSTIDPKLGFEDDDFRLYDPVLTKPVSGASKGGADKDGVAGESDGGGDEELGNMDDEDVTSIADGANEEFDELSVQKDGEDYLEDDETDPAMWAKWQDKAYRRANFLDLDPFGPANTDERRDFDDQYFFLDEEEYAYRRRIDPETTHQKPLTQLTMVEPKTDEVMVLRFDLAEETQSVLYMLHRSDPVKYTPRALAHKFQLSAARVKSVLTMQAIHYRMVENGVIHPLLHAATEESALDELLHPSMPMTHDPPKFTIQRLPDYRWVREDDMHRVLAEEQAIEDRFLSRAARLDKAEERYYAKYGHIGSQPPAPREPTILDDRVMSPSRNSIMLVDVSEMPASRFAMAVRDKRGRLREPNEQEWYYIRKQEKGIHPFIYIKHHSEVNNPM